MQRALEERARRSRADEVVEREFNSRLRLCFFRHNILSEILKGFRFSYSKYAWYIGTYHVYRVAKDPVRKRIDKLSYLTDKLRKRYPKDTVIYVTKERTECGFPHYHFLLGFKKDAWGCTPCLLKIPNMKLWSRKWLLRESFNFHSEDDFGRSIVPFYVTSRLEKVDMGARQRWFKYGIYQYLLYIFKYCDFTKFHDYFVT